MDRLLCNAIPIYRGSPHYTAFTCVSGIVLKTQLMPNPPHIHKLKLQKWQAALVIFP